MTGRKTMFRGLTAVVVLLVAAGGFGMWWVMQQPMYRPGALAGMDIVDPPRASTRWEVEPGVELSWFAVGEGANVFVVHGGPGYPANRIRAGVRRARRRLSVPLLRAARRWGAFRPAIDLSGSQWENIQALESALGIGQQLADIERIRRLLGDEQLLLVGHSYGALLAALYAAEMPWHVRGLVLIAPANLVIFPSSRGGLFDNLRDRLPAADRPAYDARVEEYFDLGGIFTKTEAELAAGDAELVRFFAAGGGSVPVAVSPPPRLLGAWHARHSTSRWAAATTIPMHWGRLRRRP